MVAHADEGFVRIEVADGSVHLPRVREYAPTSGTGRGLKLIDRTVDRWGAHLQGPGKVVWFELSSEEQDSGPSPSGRVDVAPVRDPVVAAVVVSVVVTVPSGRTVTVRGARLARSSCSGISVLIAGASTGGGVSSRLTGGTPTGVIEVDDKNW